MTGETRRDLMDDVTVPEGSVWNSERMTYTVWAPMPAHRVQAAQTLSAASAVPLSELTDDELGL
jgi:hypothetical protein